MISASCCTTNDEVDETHSYMKPVVVLETLNLTRLMHIYHLVSSQLSAYAMQ